MLVTFVLVSVFLEDKQNDALHLAYLTYIYVCTSTNTYYIGFGFSIRESYHLHQYFYFHDSYASSNVCKYDYITLRYKRHWREIIICNFIVTGTIFAEINEILLTREAF